MILRLGAQRPVGNKRIGNALAARSDTGSVSTAQQLRKRVAEKAYGARLPLNAESKDVMLPLGEMLSSFIPNRRGRKPADVPILRDSNGEAIPRYITEKHLGIRRTNGAMKLRRLTNRHLTMIGMRLEGHSLENIAFALNCTLATVSRVLNDPLSQSMLKGVYEGRKDEIHSLGGKAVDAVRDGLSKEQSIGTRLRAVDRYTKIRQTMLGEDAGDDSAEDVIARMLARMNVAGDVNIQVNQVIKKDE